MERTDEGPGVLIWAPVDRELDLSELGPLATGRAVGRACGGTLVSLVAILFCSSAQAFTRRMGAGMNSSFLLLFLGGLLL